MDDNGKEELLTWFGCSRATFAVIPRVLMEAMPDEWQYRMAVLLNQYEDTFDTTATGVHSVSVVAKDENNKFTKMPHWILNYRRPDKAAIKSITKEINPADYRYEYFNSSVLDEKMSNYSYNVSKMYRD